MRNNNGIRRIEDLDQLCQWSVTSKSAMTMCLCSLIPTRASGQCAVLATKENIKAKIMKQTQGRRADEHPGVGLGSLKTHILS